MSPKKLVSTFEAPDDNVFTLYDNWETAIARYPHVSRGGTARFQNAAAAAAAALCARFCRRLLQLNALAPHTHTLNQKQNKKVPSLGWRKRDAKGNLGPYTWLTYSQAGDIRTSIGSGLLQLGVTPKANVGLYSVNCKGWF